jgi:Zn-dependent metalloprotease
MRAARVRFFAALLFIGALASLTGPSAGVQGQERRRTQLAVTGGAELRAWDAQVDRMVRSGELELRLDREDTLMAGRRHMRFTQMVNGVPVYGGEIARQTDEKGVTVSIFGTVYEGVDISTRPALSADRVRALVTERTGVALGPDRLPRLTILPRESARAAPISSSTPRASPQRKTSRSISSTPTPARSSISAAMRTGRAPPSASGSACSASGRR